MKSQFLTQGPEIGKFEEEFARFCGAKYAVACSSATAGLHLSAIVLGIGPEDIWWTSPNTFCATADVALRCGANVDFIDIEWGTYNMDLGLLEERLRQAARKNRLPKVVAPVHFAGNPVDMEFLYKLKKKYGFKVVEDAAHATGAELRGKRVGSCTWSDLCVFSFHAVKIITTGEGGMITTNSPILHEKLCRLRTHGISRNPRHCLSCRRHSWYYEKLELGNHYRMTDIQAALGRSQLRKIRDFQLRREQIAETYTRSLSSLPLDLPRATSGARSAWHLYPVCIKKKPPLRDKVLSELHRAGIMGNLHYPSIFSLKYYRQMQSKFFPCPKATLFTNQEISLPIFPNLQDVNAKKVVSTLNKELR